VLLAAALRAAASEVAATMHQLAAVAMSSRPPRLDEAERLLQASLQREEEASAAPSANARAYGSSVISNTGGDFDAGGFGDANACRSRRGGATAHGCGQTGGSERWRRAATLQQLGRVALRRGQFERAESYLRDALELHELVRVGY
jgi:hypothetical protein